MRQIALQLDQLGQHAFENVSRAEGDDASDQARMANGHTQGYHPAKAVAKEVERYLWLRQLTPTALPSSTGIFSNLDSPESIRHYLRPILRALRLPFLHPLCLR